MTSKPIKPKYENRLWMARESRGLAPKQVTRMLGLKSNSKRVLSRYENGEHLPTLENALKLELIYGMPVRVLFYGCYEQMREKLAAKLQKDHPHVASAIADLPPEIDIATYCAHEERLKGSPLLSQEKERLRDHITFLARKQAGL